MESSTSNLKWKRKAVAFLVSQGITLFGSSLVQMAIIWYVTLKTSSGIWVMSLTVCSFIPQMLISLFAGVLADRYNRKMLIIAADAVIAAATLALALFFITGNAGQYELLIIILISTIRSLGTGVQTPTVNAMIPQLVPEEKLIRFNGINGSMQSLVQFAAPAAAGAILAAGPMYNILLVDILTAVIGVSILAAIKIPRHAVSEKAGNAAFFSEIKEGIAFAFGNKLVGRLLLIYGAFIFLCVPSGFLTPLMIERTFGQNYMYLSINEMVGCAGMVLGGLLIGAWGGFKNRNKTLASGILLYAVFSIALGLTSYFWLFAGVIFIMSLSIPVAQTSVTTLLQEKVTPEMQGRAFSLLNVMFTGFMPLGMVVFGPMADVIPIGLMMIGTGALLTLLAISIPFQKGFYGQGVFKQLSNQ